MDGVTTNGVLVMHVDGGQLNTNSKPTKWKEVSVGGNVFDLGEGRLKFNYQTAVTIKRKSEIRRRSFESFQPASSSDNILKDGTLIDLCGATLLWRSIEGLKHTPVNDERNRSARNKCSLQTRRYLELELETLNSKKPQCPVGLHTLVIKSQSHSTNSSNPYVYVSCGHVHGNHQWGAKDDDDQARECPLCRTVGPLIAITPGLESAFYMISDDEHESTTSHAFHPCGHMTSQSTAIFWSKTKVPYGKKSFFAQQMKPWCSLSTRHERFKICLSILFSSLVGNKTIYSPDFSRFDLSIKSRKSIPSY